MTHAWVAIWAGRMVNGAVAGVVLALAAGALLRLAGRQNSGTRFAVWFSALLGIAALPVVAGIRIGGANSTVESAAQLALPASWAMIAAAIWAAIAGILLARVAVGLWELRKIRREAASVDFAQMPEALRGTLEKFGADRGVELLTSASLRVPTAMGFFRPAVIFPEWTLRELSSEEQNAVLLHELAHLRRWDDWTNLAQQVLKAVFFFHPAVWWIERRLTLEREMACDHFVLAQTENPKAYAECLVALAEKSFLRRGLAMAQAMVGRVKQTSLRVAEILDGKRPSYGRGWKPGLAMVAALAMASAGEISKMPELVAFQDGAVTAASAVTESPMLVAPKPTLASYEIAKPVKPQHQKLPIVAKSVLAKSAVPRSTTGRSQVEPTLASLDVNNIASVPMIPLFVVMQTEQFGPSGEVFWSVRIYELTVFHPIVPPAQKENRAKQI